jgi:hypothetical protein
MQIRTTSAHRWTCAVSWLTIGEEPSAAQIEGYLQGAPGSSALQPWPPLRIAQQFE